MTPIATLPGTAPMASRRGSSGSDGAGDAFSQVLNRPANQTRTDRNTRSEEDPEKVANKQPDAAALENTVGKNAARTGSDADEKLSPLERLALMFGEKIVGAGTKGKGEPENAEEAAVDGEEHPAGEHGDDNVEEGVLAIVVPTANPDPDRALGRKAADETGERNSGSALTIAEKKVSTGPDLSSGEGEEGGKPAEQPSRQAVADADEAGDRKMTRGEEETRSTSRTAGASENADSRVKVVSDTLGAAPSAQQTTRTVASLAAAIAGDGEWRTAIEQLNAIDTDAPKSQQAPVRDLKIQLNPAELGEVNARLRLSGEQLSVEIQVDSREAHSRLSADRDAIVASLRGLGFQVDDVSIVQHQQTNNGQSQTQTGGRGSDGTLDFSQGSDRERDGSSGGQSRSDNSFERDSDAKAPRGRSSPDGIYI